MCLHRATGCALEPSTALVLCVCAGGCSSCAAHPAGHARHHWLAQGLSQVCQGTSTSSARAGLDLSCVRTGLDLANLGVSALLISGGVLGIPLCTVSRHFCSAQLGVAHARPDACFMSLQAA